MEVVAYSDPNAFSDDVGRLLLSREAEHNLLIGLASNLINTPDTYEEFGLWAVFERHDPVLAALVTPPWKLVLSQGTRPEAASLLAEYLKAQGLQFPGLVALEPTGTRFVEAWTDVSRSQATRDMAQGIFRLDRVEEVGSSPGSHRFATAKDRELVISWARSFMRDTTGEDRDDWPDLRLFEERLEGDRAASGIWLWEAEGRPVAMSKYSRPTPNGISVSAVYTPPENRGKGYATSLVAAQSQWLLDSGRKMCFLYTDLANPTSNAIYKRIGYRQVAESSEYSFTELPHPR